jgi:hypothetical protein
MNYFLALLSSLCLFGCCSINCATPSELAPYKESNYNFFNDGRSPNLKEFNQTLENAQSGNDQSLTTILSWASLTDGEGSLAYGNFLLKLQKIVGEKRMIAALESLNDPEQEAARYLMLASTYNSKIAEK